MTFVTQKGQVTIPKKVREMLHIEKGDEVIFEVHEEDVVIRKKESRPQFRKYIGYLKDKKGLKADEIIREMRNGVS